MFFSAKIGCLFQNLNKNLKLFEEKNVFFFADHFHLFVDIFQFVEVLQVPNKSFIFVLPSLVQFIDSKKLCFISVIHLSTFGFCNPNFSNSLLNF